MGRDCGYLALTGAWRREPTMVRFPEAGRTEDELVSSGVDAVAAVGPGTQSPLARWPATVFDDVQDLFLLRPPADQPPRPVRP